MKCSKCRGINVFDSDVSIGGELFCHLQIIPMSHSQIIRKRCKKMEGNDGRGGGSDSNLMRLFSRGVKKVFETELSHLSTTTALLRYSQQ